MVNKIPEELSNPIDNIICRQVDDDLDFYKNLGLTPNGLTTISLLITLYGFYHFYKDNHFLGALFYLIGYYFDCADGKMARKYNMFSKYGGLYDHLSDILKFIIIFILFLKKSKRKFKIVFVIFIILILTSHIFLICQEKIYNKKSKYDPISLLDFDINVETCKKYIKYFKYLGPGTVTMFMVLSILFWDKI
jgi:phosphatidylglycerophosphate synthase